MSTKTTKYSPGNSGTSWCEYREATAAELRSIKITGSGSVAGIVTAGNMAQVGSVLVLLESGYWYAMPMPMSPAVALGRLKSPAKAAACRANLAAARYVPPRKPRCPACQDKPRRCAACVAASR